MTLNALVYNLALFVILAPLAGGLIAGILGKKIGVTGTTIVAIFGVGISFIAACFLFKFFIF